MALANEFTEDLRCKLRSSAVSESPARQLSDPVHKKRTLPFKYPNFGGKPFHIVLKVSPDGLGIFRRKLEARLGPAMKKQKPPR